MKNPKPNDEFVSVDLTTGLETSAGYSKSVEQEILAGSLDEDSGTGNRSAGLQFAVRVEIN